MICSFTLCHGYEGVTQHLYILCVKRRKNQSSDTWTCFKYQYWMCRIILIILHNFQSNCFNSYYTNHLYRIFIFNANHFSLVKMLYFFQCLQFLLKFKAQTNTTFLSKIFDITKNRNFLIWFYCNLLLRFIHHCKYSMEAFKNTFAHSE